MTAECTCPDPNKDIDPNCPVVEELVNKLIDSGIDFRLFDIFDTLNPEEEQ